MSQSKILGKYYILNNKPEAAEGFRTDPDAAIYYEVVRALDRKIYFLNDHLDRLQQSLQGSGLAYPGNDRIMETLRTLMLSNDFTRGNIRICLQEGKGGKPDLTAYWVPYVYPEECAYLSGVQLSTFPHERPDPGIKRWDDRFRNRVGDHIRDFAVYEAVLINQEGEITEGSRSNIFFVDKEERVISPPLKAILPGITRKYVLRICTEAGIEVLEMPLPLKLAGSMVACFLTGTSPRVLPVRQMDSFLYQADHPTVRSIMSNFNQIAGEKLQTIL
jgi:branched-chain amino acid aminotransferase